MSRIFAALNLLLVFIWAPQARAVTEAECASQGLASVVAPYQHSQPQYDGTHRIDLYLPNTTTPAPLIIYLHGGGWKGTNWRLQCDTGVWALNRLPEGFAIASIEYSEYVEPPPTLGGTADNVIRQVREIKYAIRWLKSKKSTYKLDTSKVIIAGGSAGGHLAALTALTEGESLYSPTVPASLAGVNSAVQFVFAYAGIYNIETYTDPFAETIYGPLIPKVFGCWRPSISSWRPCSTQTMQRASPINHISANDPKIYLTHGDQDPIVPPQQSAEFAKALCKAGKLSSYNLAVSGGGTVYAHNLEPALAGNPFLGIALNLGLNNEIVPNCN